MTYCEQYDVFAIQDICKLFDLEGQLWSDLFVHVKPKFKCPLEKKSYRVESACIDLGYIADLPIEGYNWIFTLKAYRNNVRHKKQLVFCMTYEVNIVRNRRLQTIKEKGRK